MDTKMFDTQVLPIKNKLYRFAIRLLANKEDANDVVQDVFVKAWDNRTNWKDIDNLEAWCMRITRNLSIDRLRVQQKRHFEPIADKFDMKLRQLNPHEMTEVNESITHVKQIMASLGSKQQQVLHLRDVEGYSYKEISDILGLELNQVKVSLHRARKTVRERLTKLNAHGLNASK